MKTVLLPDPGTYILILRIDNTRDIEIGRIGKHTVKKGYYFYAGSAFGPGGIRARISRHLRVDKTKRWHIDYIRDAGSVVSALVNYGKKKKECTWASKMNLSQITTTPILNFGSSDCSCKSHLFYSEKRINIEKLRSLLGESVEYLKIR